MKLDIASILSRPHADPVVERLVRYASIGTTSDRHATEIPSTPQQWELARLLVDELQALGLADVELDGHCYLIARLPASPGFEGKPSIGLMAHIDTASDAPGSDVKPQIHKAWNGSPIALADGLAIDPVLDTELAEHVGDTLVCTDGRSLLGADDKAGVAEIMTAVAWLLAHPEIKHGPLEIIFTPDEETGNGMNLFPVKNLKSVACYTVDGSSAGEVEAECFSAWEAKIDITGKSIHPGYARGKLANATAMAAAYVALLPRSESPEATDGWYGYYNPHEISGGVEKARVEILVRDFEDEGISRRLATLETLARAVEAQFPGGKVEVTTRKQYLNMKRKLDENPKVLERAFEAARRAGVEPYSKPIRGGTDGSRLTEMGIPTPNIFTGGHAYHSRLEWASAAEMVLAVDTLLELVRLWSE
ncbi:MAG TPA: peptidase T [Rectinemataceae bacterium]|nr:peptidase T [Rectinemataceae bacterium]